jgi:polyisoprenoid-binding protein YceI
MNLTHAVAVAFVVAGAPSLARAAAYEIDSSHSSVGFAVRHMMVSTVRGTFGKVTGTVNWDDRALNESKIDAVIDAASIDTRDEKRDQHLRNPDFFDVAKYPVITFKSTEVKKVSEGKYKVTGNLTIRGVAKSVVLNVDAPKAEIKDPWGNIKRGATATTTLNRRDFGLTWNKALETGGVVVGEKVDVTLDLELTRKDAVTSTAR